MGSNKTRLGNALFPGAPRRVVPCCPKMANVRLPDSENGVRQSRQGGLRALSDANHAPMTDGLVSRPIQGSRTSQQVSSTPGRT
jgi:hypothetical protein